MKARAMQCPHEQRELRDAAGDDADRQRGDGDREPVAQPPGGADHRDIEQHRRERDDTEAALDVEHRTHQRDQRNQPDVAERDPGQILGDLRFFRRGVEASGQQADQRLGENHDERNKQQQHHAQQSCDAADEGAAFLGGLARAQFRQHRNEGLAERALGKQAPQHVRRAKRHVEGVHLRTGAEPGRAQDLARQSRHARNQGHAADRGHGLEEIHAVGKRRALPRPGRGCTRSDI